LNIKEGIGLTIGIISLMSIGYAAALRGGYVIDRALAQEIAQQAVEPEERARLEFVRETKFSRLRFLNGLENKSPDDLLEMEVLRDDIKRIADRLEELEK
jgi:hypothetical protein